MKENIEIPSFVKAYLLSKFRICLIIAIPSILIAGFVIFHMSITTLEDFKMEMPVQESVTERSTAFPTSMHVNNRTTAREVDIHNTHIAPDNYGMYIFFMTLFAVVLVAIFIVFISFAGSIWLNMKGHPRSRMYDIFKQYDNPQDLLNQIDCFFSSQYKESSHLDPIVNEHFVLIPKFSYIFIAPTIALDWAYVALIITNHRNHSSTKYHVKFHFHTKDEQFIAMDSKDKGVQFLKNAKNIAPWVAIGHNRICPHSQKDISRHFFGLISDE